MTTSSKKIYILFNTRLSLNGMSGGDRINLEFIKYWNNLCDLYILGTNLNYNFLIKNKIKINEQQFIEFPESKFTPPHNSLKIVFIYLKRIFSFLRNYKKYDFSNGDLLYSSSDLIADSIIACFIKIKNPKIKWVSGLYLIARNPFVGFENQKSIKIKIPSLNLLGFWLLQKISFFCISRYADEIWVLNKFDKKILEEKTFAKIHVINGGIDFKKIASIPKKEIQQYDASFVGRFHPQKGIFDLIKIWKLVCVSKPTAKLCVIGDGPKPYVNKIKSLIKENNLMDNIELLGTVSGDEKFSLIKSTKIFVCSSLHESWALVIAEAMACSLPVISYDLPIYEGIYENNILKIPVSDINQFAEMILKLLDDADLAVDLGQNGQKFIEKYDWNKTSAREYEQILDLCNDRYDT
ncbi:glycosyltransferase [bacterium]|nr:glycosyltransferase [bacterium]MBI9073652.1 glycosyltransferase [Melioribacteraceae bacterium]